MKTSLLVLFFALAAPCVAEKDVRRRAQTTPSPTPSGDVVINADRCFSEVATVDVFGQGVTAMKDLKVGDKVLTASGNYQAVYAFGHYHETAPTEFLQIQTKGNPAPLEMTTEHLVFVHGKKHPVRADSVQVGDILQGHNENAPVTKIDTITRNGRYAPLTQDTTLVVDGIQASSYIALQDDNAEYMVFPLLGSSIHWSHENYVHWTLAPFRVGCAMSSKLCHSYTDEGLPGYIDFGIGAHKWAHGYGGVVEVVFVFLALLLFVGCRLIEAVMAAPLMALGVGAVVVYLKKSKKEAQTVSKDEMMERLLEEGDVSK